MIRQITCLTVACDVCRAPLELDDRELRVDTEEQARGWAEYAEWTDLGRGRLACTRDDAAHDEARDTALRAALNAA